jgi:hypothetical protein
MTDTELPSQRTIEHKNIQKKIKPGTKNDRLLLEYVKYVGEKKGKLASKSLNILFARKKGGVFMN